MLSMDEIGIRELRQHASVHVRSAAAGESLTITDRGVPVARLVPVTELEERLHELVKSKGLVPPSRGRRRYTTDTRLTGDALSSLVDEGRDDRAVLEGS